jgi:glycosyltransferase involved in cell wall biosynthesis
MDGQRRISVVIRAFNESAHIGRLLQGLSQQTVKPDQVIVVDSGSTDNTVDIASAAGCTIVHIEKSEFSFGRALNLGCSESLYEVIVILSAHVYPVYDTYLENLVKAFDHSGVGVAYGRQVGDQRTRFSESRIMLKWFPAKNVWDQGHPFSNNANAAILKTLWQQQTYDESLTGLEDLEFAKRALNLGHKVSYVADSPVVHVHEESWNNIRNRYRREAVAYSRIIDGSKMSLLKAIGLMLANIALDYFHSLKSHNRLKNLSSIPFFRSAQFFGAWQGFNKSDDISGRLLNRFYYPSRPAARNTDPQLGNEIQYSGGQ